MMYNDAREAYIAGKNNINEDNIEIYINDKKIKFITKYKSKEIGLIKVRFKFKKLLTSTSYMFRSCSSLISIDLSSFNATNITNMRGMFYSCSSLKSINLSACDTNNVYNMRGMFKKCTSLESLDLSSFKTTNVNNLDSMFANCSSLKSLDLTYFDTTNINVTDMSRMFDGCFSLKKENVKVYDKKILASFIHNDFTPNLEMYYNDQELTINVECPEGTQVTAKRKKSKNSQYPFCIEINAEKIEESKKENVTYIKNKQSGKFHALIPFSNIDYSIGKGTENKTSNGWKSFVFPLAKNEDDD